MIYQIINFFDIWMQLFNRILNIFLIKFRLLFINQAVLHLAIEMEDVKMVELLLAKKNIDVNMKIIFILWIFYTI